jgi:AraC family transcriptional regulator of adaptative response/methylated-DNA-[protein]-cysteine methyltransferase
MDVLAYDQLSQDYDRIAQVIRYIDSHQDEQPSLKELAQVVNLSEYHFQRLFSRWVGISPKRFMQYLTKEKAKQLLRDSDDILSVAHATGLSGPGRLHDLFVTCEAVTPGEYKSRGQGIRIHYGFHPSPFGECLVAQTERGICSLMFVEAHNWGTALSRLRANWPAAEIEEDHDGTRMVIDEMMELFGRRTSIPLRLYLNGTNFQIKVWEALLQIPPGSVVSYEEVAIYIGAPKASRAVGNAISRNPIPVLIPCHRVIRKTGQFGDYRWGASRKKALLGWELARHDVSSVEAGTMVGAS